MVATLLRTDENSIFEGFDAFLLPLQVIGYPTHSGIRRRRLEPVPNIKDIKSNWEKPKESISVSLKTKARRNELWSPLSLTESKTLKKRREFLSLV